MTDKGEADLWAAEYAKGGIPSSMRETPSGAVVWAVEQLKRLQFPLRFAADIGCGKGRNSLYLMEQGMEVTAMDFTPDAVQHVQRAAAEHGFGNKIRAIVQDVGEPWPVASGSMDLVVDAFCFKHIVPNIAREEYKRNLWRVLRTRGHYLISFASIGDGYYGRYIIDPQSSEDEQLVADPENGIQSVLYSRRRVLQFFAPELDLFAELHHTKPSVMHGQEYGRDTYALLLRRNPHIV